MIKNTIKSNYSCSSREVDTKAVHCALGFAKPRSGEAVYAQFICGRDMLRVPDAFMFADKSSIPRFAAKRLRGSDVSIVSIAPPRVK